MVHLDLTQAVGRASPGSVTGVTDEMGIRPADCRHLCEQVLEASLAGCEISDELGRGPGRTVADLLGSLLAASCVLGDVPALQGSFEAA